MHILPVDGHRKSSRPIADRRRWSLLFPSLATLLVYSLSFILLSGSHSMKSLVAAYDTSHKIYTSEFAVEIDGGHGKAVEVATRNGYTIVSRLSPTSNIYLLTPAKRSKRRRRQQDARQFVQFRGEAAVKFIEQQTVLRRTKRDFVPYSSSQNFYQRQNPYATSDSISTHFLSEDHSSQLLSNRQPQTPLTLRGGKPPRMSYYQGYDRQSYVQPAETSYPAYLPRNDVSLAFSFNDPLFHNGKSWYLTDDWRRAKRVSRWQPDDVSTSAVDGGGHYRVKTPSMKIVSAWSRGHNGTGVVVTILDDGVETDHVELARNYDPLASTDLNGKDGDPTPRETQSNENRHGTRCAGVVAASANNNFCSVGVAFAARIGGIRMLDGEVTDFVEAQSIGYQRDHVDIYSSSWGPEDDGRTVDGPGILAKKAMAEGVRLGRRGLGSIYVWASGNGGKHKDSCACDGYTNSRYTLSVSAVSQRGHVPWYNEACASTLAATYSSGKADEGQVVTADLRQQCTEQHTGTSASAPMAAGIIALALSANPRLTWRDVQHLVVATSKTRGLTETAWSSNGLGKRFSGDFGFGLMDAEHLTRAAADWQPVPRAFQCHVTPDVGGTRGVSISRHDSAIQYRIPPHSWKAFQIYTDGCAEAAVSDASHYDGHILTPFGRVAYLEHVVLRVDKLRANRRGSVSIELQSPSGTRSVVLPYRDKDFALGSFDNWEFMTVHFWGERANGTWTLTVRVQGTHVNLDKWSIILYGTQEPPAWQHPSRLSDYLEGKAAKESDGRSQLYKFDKDDLPANNKRRHADKSAASSDGRFSAALILLAMMRWMMCSLI